jgi:predicted nucleic acid-binding protein
VVSAPSLLDTNILIDALSGLPAAMETIRARPDRAISIITWIEVMAGVTTANEAQTRDFLNAFPQLQITGVIANAAALIRRTYRLKLPDAIILATAQVENRLLITRNTRDFPAADLGVYVPYKLE